MDRQLPVAVADAAQYSIRRNIRGLLMPYSQVILCTAGRGELFCENSMPVRFEKGDMLYIAPSLLHGFVTSYAELNLISVCGEYSEYVFEYFGFGYSGIVRNCGDPAKDFLKIVGDTVKGAEDDIRVSSSLYELITEMGIKKLEQEEKRSVGQLVLQEVSDYLAENYSKENFSYEPLLCRLGIDSGALDALIAADCGMSAEEYYLHFRLEVLRSLLYLRPHLNIARCAVTNGFRSCGEFEREFRRKYGIGVESIIS